MEVDTKLVFALLEFSNKLKENLDNFNRQRNFYPKGEISKRIDYILEKYLDELRGDKK